MCCKVRQNAEKSAALRFCATAYDPKRPETRSEASCIASRFIATTVVVLPAVAAGASEYGPGADRTVGSLGQFVITYSYAALFVLIHPQYARRPSLFSGGAAYGMGGPFR